MRSLFSLFLILLAGLFLVVLPGCDKDDEIVNPSDEWAPPTSLKALSLPTQVRLTWTGSADASSPDFLQYKITTRQGTTVFKVDSTTSTTFTVTGLTNGQEYIFSVQTQKDDRSLSTEATIGWGPTTHYTANARIYEFASANPSAIQFSTGTQVNFTSSSPDNRGIVDLWIDGRAGATPLLKSPSDQTLSTGWRTTRLAQVPVGGTATLETWSDVPAANSFTTNPLTIAPSNVYWAITQDNHYVRFVTSAIQGTAPNRYIDLQISYNAGTGAWAKR